MAQNITDVVTFTSPIVSVADGDVANGADFLTAPQGLANRTAYLNNLFLANTFSGAGGTTTLTASSNGVQVITGTAGQTFKLPDETTVALGRQFTFINKGTTGTLTIKDSAGTTLASIPATLPTGGTMVFVSDSIASATGNWVLVDVYVPGQVPGTQSNDTAASGNIGEVIGVGADNTSISSSATNQNVTSTILQIPAGAWRASWVANFNFSGPTGTSTVAQAGLSTSTTSFVNGSQTPNANGVVSLSSFQPVISTSNLLTMPSYCFQLATTLQLYFLVRAIWTTGTATVSYYVQIERAR